jgi:hypothetical protein
MGILTIIGCSFHDLTPLVKIDTISVTDAFNVCYGPLQLYRMKTAVNQKAENSKRKLKRYSLW